jgi:hypothetical protein
MTKFYSASTKGFYSTEIHGPRTVMVPDPLWLAPEPSEDPDAAALEAPLIEVNNHLCGMPFDAIPITDSEWRSMLEQQESGKVIIAGSNGAPEAVTPAATPLTWDDIRRTRRTLRAESDFSQLPDVRARIGAELAAAWDVYRTALTDVTTHFLTPGEVIWPVKPE